MVVHAFDIDGVVTTQDRLIECVGIEYQGFLGKHLVDYSIGESLYRSGFIGSVEEFSNGYFFTKYGRDILAQAGIAEGFKEYYEGLLSAGDDVCFITARRPSDEVYTRELFKVNGIDYESVHHTSDPINKDRLVRELGVGVFYEDNLQTGLRVADKVGIDVVIYDAPYNRVEKFPYSNMRRIKRWEDLLW